MLRGTRVQRLKDLCSEVAKARELRLARLEETLGEARRDELKRAGISGSAILIDVEQTEEWQEAIRDIELEFAWRKKKLLTQTRDDT